jgi:hypothetical protein
MEAVPEVYRPLVTEAAVAAKVFAGGPTAFAEQCAMLQELGVGTVVLFPDPADPTALGRIGASKVWRWDDVLAWSRQRQARVATKDAPQEG